MRGGHNVKSAREKSTLGTSQKCRDEKRLENFAKAVEYIPPPPHFNTRLVKKWDWLCIQLSKHSLLTEADVDIMRVYCENWVIWEDCSADVLKNGATLWIQTSAGKKPITNPAFRHLKDCETILKQIWEHFGLTPRARMGLKVEKPKTASVILEMIKGKAKAV